MIKTRGQRPAGTRRCRRGRTTRRSLPLGLLLVGAAIGLGGCVTSNVEQVRQGTTSLASGESIMVLGRRHQNDRETEDNFIACLEDHLDRSLNVYSEAQAADDLYPWFEPRTAPQRPEDMRRLLERPLVRATIDRQRVRYVVWVDGTTLTTDRSGSMSCTIAPTGMGCFGFMSFDQDSSYEMTIWDIRDFRTVGHISSESTGTTYVPAVILPVPLYAQVKGSACKSLGNQLEAFLSGQNTAS